MTAVSDSFTSFLQHPTTIDVVREGGLGIVAVEDHAFLVVDSPLRSGGLLLETKAADYIAKMSRGYPYFLQEWGYQIWNQAEA